jgi:hypothetical protein
MAREQKISEARAIAGVTRLFAIVGDPIVQMRSPQGYTQAFAQQQFALPTLRALCRSAPLAESTHWKSRASAHPKQPEEPLTTRTF